MQVLDKIRFAELFCKLTGKYVVYFQLPSLDVGDIHQWDAKLKENAPLAVEHIQVEADELGFVIADTAEEGRKAYETFRGDDHGEHEYGAYALLVGPEGSINENT